MREYRVIDQPLTGRYAVVYFVGGNALYVLETFPTEAEATRAADEYNGT